MREKEDSQELDYLVHGQGELEGKEDSQDLDYLFQGQENLPEGRKRVLKVWQ